MHRYSLRLAYGKPPPLYRKAIRERGRQRKAPSLRGLSAKPTGGVTMH